MDGSLLADIIDCAIMIYQGRQWQSTDGLEHEGRISYIDGLLAAMSAFQSAQEQAPYDLRLLILAEYTFLDQERKYCDITDTQTAASLDHAIQSFKDALLSLHVVENGSAYIYADMTYPHDAKHRFRKMARDAFHEACLSHRTRIDNILRAPGINLMEKKLLLIRKSNLAIAQDVYVKKQIIALEQS